MWDAREESDIDGIFIQCEKPISMVKTNEHDQEYVPITELQEAQEQVKVLREALMKIRAMAWSRWGTISEIEIERVSGFSLEAVNALLAIKALAKLEGKK